MVGIHPGLNRRHQRVKKRIISPSGSSTGLGFENYVYVERDLPVSHVQKGALWPRRGRYMSSMSTTSSTSLSATSWALPPPPRCLADMSTKRIA
jgi:hypothetical protein